MAWRPSNRIFSFRLILLMQKKVRNRERKVDYDSFYSVLSRLMKLSGDYLFSNLEKKIKMLIEQFV